MQIDVTNVGGSLRISTLPGTDCPNYVFCDLYTGDRVVKIIMARYEYENLIRDGFFIRDGKERDSAGVLNTTKVYELKGGKDE
jgi:hypothetical protein